MFASSESQSSDRAQGRRVRSFDFLFREYGNQGRWPSPDPAGLAAVDLTDPQSLDAYCYVRESPLNFIDLFGLEGTPVQVCFVNGRMYTGATCNLLYDTFCRTWASFGFGESRCSKSCPLGDCVRDRPDRDGNGGPGVRRNEGCVQSIFNPECKPPKRPTCWAVFQNAATNADPVEKLTGGPTPPGTGLDDASRGVAGAAVIKHIMERGLVVPLRSSIVRNILTAGETTASVAALAPIDYQLGVGVVAEAKARYAGECRTVWDTK